MLLVQTSAPFVLMTFWLVRIRLAKFFRGVGRTRPVRLERRLEAA
ncbi:MAG: hypothetical protein ACREHV_15045 [Rhizomicrobium sp.]